MSIRVLTVDDHALVRAGIRAMLTIEPDITVVGEAADGAEAVERYAGLSPDVVLMDLRMPHVDGVAAIVAIRAADPQARIIALSTYNGDVDIHRALAAGACAFLVKDVLVSELIDAIRNVAAGRRVLPGSVAAALAEYVPRVELTPRELEVLRLVAKGLRNTDIARVMGLTTGTVKVHLKNVFSKLGSDDRTEAVTIGLQRGFIQLDG
jgi:two-component system NarL family response regulator